MIMNYKSLNTGEFYIFTPKHFDFWRTVYSHGWCALKPFDVDKEKSVLKRLFTTRSGELVYCFLSNPQQGSIKVNFQTGYELHKYEKFDLIDQIAKVFRLDEDLAEFYKEAKRDPRFKWIHKFKAGRMLRCPTVFEDVVKMICTTNCSWALTEIMVNNLTTKLGKEFHYVTAEGKKLIAYSFPTFEAFCNVDEKYLREEIKVGYRAPYLLDLVKKIISGEVNVEGWRVDTSPTDILYKKMLEIKGVGPYAAQNLLKLLGRYDYLGIDSWSRAKFFEIHKNGRKVSDKTIEKFYEKYGKWRGLFFWMDVTKHWYEDQFPF